MKPKLLLGILIGLTITIIIQHLLYGTTDPDYNIFIQLRRVF